METLRYHDFHLRGYSVSDFGSRIELDLVHDYPGCPEKVESRITFSGVVCYSFVHPSGAILTEIDEVPVASLVAEELSFLTEAARQHGLEHWGSGPDEYVRTLQKEWLRAWRLESAVGFSGFVIALNVEGHAEAVVAPAS